MTETTTGSIPIVWQAIGWRSLRLLALGFLLRFFIPYIPSDVGYVYTTYPDVIKVVVAFVIYIASGYLSKRRLIAFDCLELIIVGLVYWEHQVTLNLIVP